jgi:hypothetical protein
LLSPAKQGTPDRVEGGRMDYRQELPIEAALRHKALRRSTGQDLGTESNAAVKIDPVGYNHIITYKGYASIETPVAELASQPFCPLCKAWGGERSSVELVITKGAHADVLSARHFEELAHNITLFSNRLFEAVVSNAPELRPRFRRASDRSGAVWQELLAPAQVLYCGIRGAQVPYASRCGRCGHLGAYCPDMKYVGTFCPVSEEDVAGGGIFYSAQFFRNNPPTLVATGAGVKLLRDLGCVFGTMKVAVLRSADVDRMPNVKIFHEPV